MSNKEYYLILPLLLYGLAISDLVNSWKSFFFAERRYWPYIVTSILLLEAAFWNFFRMNDWMTEGSYENYLSYSRFIVTPLAFIVTVAVFTPDQDTTDTEQYFKSNMRLIFGSLAVFVTLHFFFVAPWEMSLLELTGRVAMIVLLLLTALLKYPRLVYLLFAVRIMGYFVFS
jgi:hypothetical protein